MSQSEMELKAMSRFSKLQWLGRLSMVLALSCSFALSGLAAEMPPSAQGQTLEEIEFLALENNPSIKVAFGQWRASLASVAAARSLPDPNLSYAEFIEEVQTKTGPQKRNVSVSQMFPWFGTLDLRKDAAVARAEALFQNLERSRWNVLKDLRLSLFQWILLDRKIKINQEHVSVLGDLETSIQGRLASGKGSLASVLRVQVEKDRLSDLLATLKASQRPFLQAIQTALGSSSSVDLSLALPKDFPAISPLPQREELLSLYRQWNPEWKGNTSMIKTSQAEIELARKKGRPNVGLGLTWIDIEPTNATGSRADPVALTLSLSLPIWRKKVNADIASAMELDYATKSMGENLLNRFSEQLDMAIFKVEDADRKISLYKDSLLSKAEDAYRSTKKSNEAGEASFQNVLDAERIFLLLRLEYEQARADRATSFAVLESMVGNL